VVIKKTSNLMIFMFFFFMIPIIAYSDNIAIAILDFEVQSTNENHQFLGKGFAEFISVELSHVDKLVLIEREKRNEIIDEMKFGLSGIANEDSLVELGNLLLSKILIAGQIFDINGSLVVTSRLIDVESGKVYGYSIEEGTLAQYKAIIQSLTLGILNSLDIEHSYIARKIDFSKDDETVLTKFSEAVDAVDSGNDNLARKKLNEAAAIDKENEAVKILANKLNVVSPKFQFEDPLWQSSYNPAMSAMLDTGILYTRSTFFGLVDGGPGAYWAGNDAYPVITIGETSNLTYLAVQNFTFNSHIGYNFPVSDRIGINTEIVVSNPNENTEVSYNNTGDANSRDVPVIIDGVEVFQGSRYSPNVTYLGITGGGSYKFRDSLSFGLNGSVFIPVLDNYSDGEIVGVGDSFDFSGNTIGKADDSAVYALPDKIGFLLNLGMVSYLFSQKLYVDLNIANLFMPRYYYDYERDAYINGTYPIYISSSINGILIDNILFFGSKTNLDVYKDPDAKGVYLKETAVLEFWPIKYFSIRGGYNFSYYTIDERTSLGHGFMAGGTIKLGAFEIDVNYSLRQAPLISVEQSLLSIDSLFFSISYSDFWPKR